MNTLLEKMRAVGVIPVIVIDDLSRAVPLAHALVKGGLPILEVTFRTACAAEAIAKIKAEVPRATLIAGTILTSEQLENAKKAGAEACVAPGFDPAIVSKAKEIGMPFCPGVATASELSQALALGCKFVKFFPAQSAGGAKYIKDLLGAFRWTNVCFMPTGGINVNNLADYLSIKEIACCGGTWVVPKTALAAGDWSAIENLAKEAVALVRSIR